MTNSKDKSTNIALVMMLKNEEKRLLVTLNSVIGFVDSMIIFDTGSTDNTISKIYEFSKTHGIPYHLKQGEFIDFSKSRNELLDFADSIDGIDFLLLMDCNDELRGGPELRKFAEKQPLNKTAWLVNQEWFSGVYNTYYNIRFIRARCTWRYNGVVHEWLKKEDEDVYITDRIPLPVCLYQDRTQDDDKSGKRFHRDYELLLHEFNVNPQEPRTVFYLAQTCSCLNKNTEAYKYYEIRSTLHGFEEEVFHSLLRLGDICKTYAINDAINEIEQDTKWEKALFWYSQAVSHSPRAEPLVAIAEYYRLKKQWLLSFMYARMACDLDYPTNAILFVDNYTYTYTRYHLLGIVSYYCNRFNEGYQACLKAIQAENKEIDKNNLEFYSNVLTSNIKKSQRKRR